jgi:hypothetical protein
MSFCPRLETDQKTAAQLKMCFLQKAEAPAAINLKKKKNHIA